MILSIIFFCLPHAVADPLPSTPNEFQGLKVVCMYKVPRSQELAGKPGVAIVLQKNTPFYVGNLYYVLHIGKSKFYLQRFDDPTNRHYTFLLTLDEWRSLKSGEPMTLTWGEGEGGDIPLKPFAYLEKRQINRCPQGF